MMQSRIYLTLAFITSLSLLACSDPDQEPVLDMSMTTPEVDMGAPPKLDMNTMPKPEQDMSTPPADMTAREDMSTPPPEDMGMDMAQAMPRTVTSHTIWSEDEVLNRVIDPRMTQTYNSVGDTLWSMIKFRMDSVSIWRVIRVVSHLEPEGGRYAYAVSEIENGWETKVIGSYVTLNDPLSRVSLWLGVPASDVSKPGFKWPEAYITYTTVEEDGIVLGLLEAEQDSAQTIDGILWQRFQGLETGDYFGRAFLFGYGDSSSVFYVKKPEVIPMNSNPGGLHKLDRIERVEAPAILRKGLEGLAREHKASPPRVLRRQHPHRL